MPQRVLVVGDGDGEPADVFELVALDDKVARVKTAFLFEIGEELTVRIEDGATTSDAIARVRAHVGGVTELDLIDRAAPR